MAVILSALTAVRRLCNCAMAGLSELVCQKKQQRYSPKINSLKTDGDFKSPGFRIMSNPLLILACGIMINKAIGQK